MPDDNENGPAKNYIIEFDYQGPRSNIPGCHPEADRALANADSEVESALDRSGLTWSHEYAWTDGSLFKNITSSLPKAKILSKLRIELSYTDIKIASMEHKDTDDH